MIQKIFEIFKFLLTVALIVLPIRLFVAQPFIVQGSSMEPTFQQSDYLVVDQLSYRFREPQRGEVIVFKYPLDPSKFFIKRIVGLPKEEITIEKNEIFIQEENGQKLEINNEKYIKNADFGSLEKKKNWTLGENEYFVLGDNRANSSDSRYFGTLNKNFIAGRAWLRLWPINEIDYLPGYYKFKI